MTIIVGGLRRRLIKDNLELLLNDCLDSLGWFDTNRQHKPVSLVGTMVENSTEIKPNLVSISAEVVTNTEMEMGSGLEENRWTFYIDIYAENEDVGLHLAGDIYDIIRGKMSSVGRSTTEFVVLDLTQATPSELFYCDIDNIDIARSRDWTKAYSRYWWTIGLDVLDYYNSEAEG